MWLYKFYCCPNSSGIISFYDDELAYHLWVSRSRSIGYEILIIRERDNECADFLQKKWEEWGEKIDLDYLRDRIWFLTRF